MKSSGNGGRSGPSISEARDAHLFSPSGGSRRISAHTTTAAQRRAGSALSLLLPHLTICDVRFAMCQAGVQIGLNTWTTSATGHCRLGIRSLSPEYHEPCFRRLAHLGLWVKDSLSKSPASRRLTVESRDPGRLADLSFSNDSQVPLRG